MGEGAGVARASGKAALRQPAALRQRPLKVAGVHHRHLRHVIHVKPSSAVESCICLKRFLVPGRSPWPVSCTTPLCSVLHPCTASCPGSLTTLYRLLPWFPYNLVPPPALVPSRSCTASCSGTHIPFAPHAAALLCLVTLAPHLTLHPLPLSHAIPCRKAEPQRTPCPCPLSSPFPSIPPPRRT